MVQENKRRVRNGLSGTRHVFAVSSQNQWLHPRRLDANLGGDNRPYVRTRLSTYKDKSGKLRFRTIIIFSREVEWKIHAAILEKYRQREEAKHVRTIKSKHF